MACLWLPFLLFVTVAILCMVASVCCQCCQFCHVAIFVIVVSVTIVGHCRSVSCDCGFVMIVWCVCVGWVVVFVVLLRCECIYTSCCLE